MTTLDQALEKSRRTLDFEFDDKLYAIRRNLMVASSVVIGSTFLSPPKNGLYEVNVGVLKGVVEKPEYISYFLALVCIYYLVWFIVHCRKVTVNNYQNIKHQFMSHVAALRVGELYSSLYNHIEKNLPVPPQFRASGGGGGKWTVGVEFVERVEIEHALGIQQLKDAGFNIQKSNGKLKITYQYEAVFEDFRFLNIHLDHYWRGKLSYLFTTVLPMVYSSIAIVLLALHIYNQLIG